MSWAGQPLGDRRDQPCSRSERYLRCVESDCRSSLARFAAAIAESSCTFASSASLLDAPVLQSSASASEIVGALIPALQDLASADVETENWQGAVVAFADRAAGDTIEAAAWTVRRTLEAIADVNQDAAESLRRDVTAPEWWYVFAGCELLVITFAPVYPPEHPRHSPSDETFLLFQPHRAFSARRPPGSQHFPQGTKRVIRDAYRAAGRPYDTALADSKREAHKFVKPLTIGAPPVRWWEAQPPGSA
jgi:FPC/CPF motif-containing protein YcgG